jgi:hypothetical protein
MQAALYDGSTAASTCLLFDSMRSPGLIKSKTVSFGHTLRAHS